MVFYCSTDFIECLTGSRCLVTLINDTVLFILIVTVVPGVLGLVTVKPVKTEAFVGENVTLSCNTTSVEAVDWRRKLHSSDRFEIFCYSGSIAEGREDKFSISNPHNGYYEVVVKDVQINDSGQYRCIEGVDDPDYGTVVLSVQARVYSHVAVNGETSTGVIESTTVDMETLTSFPATEGLPWAVWLVVWLIVVIAVLMLVVITMCVNLHILRRKLRHQHQLDVESTRQLLKSSSLPGGDIPVSESKQTLSLVHHINWINREVLETVLLKATAVACHKTADDEAAAIETLCGVSRHWWNIIMNCSKPKKVSFQQYIDSLQKCQRASLKVRLQTTAVVQGVAYLDDAVSKVYVVCMNSDTISVFHAMPPYEQLRGIHVNGLQEPTDIAACDINRLLYVSDWAEGCVWQVTTGGKVDQRFPTWSPVKRKAKAVYPVSLSVRSGRLAVVEINKVSVCNAHDDGMDEIKFPESVTLYHATETEHHSVLVALTDSSADVSRSTIREMRKDHDGKWIVAQELDLSSILPHAYISQSQYMTWDACGHLYVAADKSHKVLVLDSALNAVRSVRLRKRSIPNRMCSLSQHGILLLIVDGHFSVNVYSGIH